MFEYNVDPVVFYHYSIDEYLAEDDYVPPDDDSLILLDRCKLFLQLL